MILLFPTLIHLKSEQARKDFRPRSVPCETDVMYYMLRNVRV